MTDTTEILRYANVVLAVYILAQCVRPRAVRWWRMRPAELRFLLLGLLALAGSSVWGSIETLATYVPGGSRVFILTLALAWTATGVTILHHRIKADNSMRPRKYPTGTRKDES